MSQNDIKVTFRIAEDGTLKAVTANTKKLAKETSNLSNSQEALNKSKNTYQRQEKGTAQITSNSTKAFSKQAQTLGGGSGLVPAYATLAANIFAVTAAFGVLQRAAAVDQLVKGMASLGKDSGYAMMTLSKGLKEATGNALSLEEAMRSTAMITSAGFDASTVEQIGVAAQKSAVALGRNTQESLERFTRGLVKMEAELLDELGLFPRVDTAAAEYARSIGKSANELTQFEKRQAFANAALKEAEEKFGSVEVETNPYDQLSASFSDLTKTILSFLNAGILPVVSFLGSSTGALIALMGAFASTISQDLLGGLSSYAEKAKETSLQQKGLTQSARKSLDTYNRSSNTLTALSQSLEDGSASNREYQSAINGQNLSIKTNTRLKKLGTISEEEYTARVKTANRAIKEINATQIKQRLSTAANAEAKTIAALSAGKYSVALKNLNRTFKFYGASLKTATAAQGLFNKTLKIGSVTAKFAATSFRLLGAAVSALLGPISTVIALGTLLYEAFSWLYDKTLSESQKALNTAIEDSEEPLKEITTNLKAVDERLSSTSTQINAVTKGTIAYSNSLNSLNAQLNKFSATGAEDAYLAQRDALQDIISKSDTFRNAYEQTFGNTVIPRTKEGVKAAVEFAQKQELLATRAKGIEAAFKGAGTATQEFFNKFKETTSFTPLLNSLQELGRSIKGELPDRVEEIIQEGFSTEPLLKALVAATRDNGNADIIANLKNGIKKSEENINTLTAELNKGGTSERMADIAIKIGKEYNVLNASKAALIKFSEKENTVGKEAIQNAINLVSAQNESLINSKRRVGTLTTQLAAEKAIGDQSVASLEKQIGLQNSILTEKRKANNTEISMYQTILKTVKTEEERANLETRIKELKASNLLLDKQAIEGLEVTLQIQQLKLANLQQEQKYSGMLLDLDKRRMSFAETSLSLRQKTLEAAKKDANRKDPTRGYNPALTARDELDISKELLSQRVQQAIAERDIKLASIDMEYTLLKARLEVAETEARLAAEKSTDPEQKGRLTGLADSLNTQISTFTTLQGSAQKQVAEAFASNILGIVEGYKGQLDTVVSTALAGTKQGSMKDRVQSFGTLSAEQQEALPMSQQVEALQGMVSPMIDQLATIGPEGELMASITNGAFAMADAFTGAFEAIKAGGSVAENGLAMAGSAITAIASIQAAQSKAAIAGIDKQIEAEKKRDGQSQASLAKIAAMEAKKDKLKRKAFEQDKKAKMASVVMNTASAVMGLWNVKDPYVGPALATAYTGLVVGLGAAQLAAISSTSYDGGGASAPSAPTGISVGNRSSSVDMARSQSPSGELSYLRGERGQGTPENYTPAFTGMKYRASGGSTAGFMVGEQGPELFVPEKPGRIMPADESTGNSAPVNVNFSISAIDASGVEELLMTQQGNIIGMIRTAANAHGETFLESVDERALTMEK